MSDTESACPCGSGAAFNACCGRYIKLGAYPQRADLLMRSRYTAYTLNDIAYLTKTWDSATCPPLDEDELRQTQWLRLEILNHKPGHKKASVEFKAWFQTAQGETCLHENSLFRKIKNRWVYVEPLS